jgi:hypothetical protein
MDAVVQTARGTAAEAPTGASPPLVAAVSRPTSGDETRFVARTVRSATVVTLIVLVGLGSYGQVGLLAPLALGAGLGILLLYVMDRQVRMLCTPHRIPASGEKKRIAAGVKEAMLVIALIKYPLVAVMIWAVIHRWHADLPALFAFAGGYILIHFVIALRAIGASYFVPSP